MKKLLNNLIERVVNHLADKLTERLADHISDRIIKRVFTPKEITIAHSPPMPPGLMKAAAEFLTKPKDEQG